MQVKHDNDRRSKYAVSVKREKQKNQTDTKTDIQTEPYKHKQVWRQRDKQTDANNRGTCRGTTGI